MNAAIKLSSPATSEFWEIPVLHEDEHLLALDKPAGLLVSPDKLEPDRPSLIKLLHAAIAAGKPWARERNVTYLVNTHRLDADTTGVLLLAKNKAALVEVANQLGTDTPIRKYLALVQGVPPDATFSVDEKIGSHPLQPGRMRIDPRNGKKSKTECTVVESYSKWSLIHCVPGTERTQQVLLHLSHVGFPVVGDESRGGKKLWLSRLKKDFYLKPGHDERPLISRVALHAEELNLLHPATRAPLTLKSEWPKDIRVAVKYLRQYA